MGFTDLLGAPSVEGTGRSKIPSSESTSSLSLTSSSEPTSVTRPDHIEEEAYIMDPDPERPDLRELNSCLHALAAIFPNIQIEVFRDMLASFDGESRLSLVTDALLKNDVSWVKGRWRVTAEEGQEEELVPKKETFRSPEYKQAVKSLAWHEFKGLSRSAINAVLAENNYSYLDARQTLVDLSSKSWRFTISSLFRRRKPVSTTEAENHPLVIWKSTDQGSTIPTLKSTGNAELDQELFTALVTPLKEQARAALEAEDRKMAAHLNNVEAEQTDSMIECACCFTEAPFEEFTSCTDRGHMLCVQCVKRCISEAVFGQGWQMSVNNKTGCLRCFAPSAKKCKGDISKDHMERAMSQDRQDHEILRQLEDRLADYSVAASNLPLVRCHFCGYAEVDDTYQPVTRSDFRFRTDQLNTLSLIILAICCIPWVVPFAALASFSLLIPSIVCILVACYDKRLVGVFMTRFVSEMRNAVIRRRERSRGLRFNCRRPSCGRKSCIRCEKGWTDVHVCHMSSLDALRTQVEQAMSFAVKRVCPRCNTSFVRDSGCNRMRCPCGYEMCYICRADINGKTRDSSYQHFCNHFWEDPTKKQCTDCTKCSLYEVEKEELVLRKAREAVEKRWQLTEKRELSRAELVYLERSLPPSEHWGLGEAVANRRRPRLADVCDVLLMTFFAPSP